MSAINQVLAAYTPAGAAISYIGANAGNSAGSALTVNYPAGTASGDLVVVIQHHFSESAPSGFTLAFTTAGDENGYKNQVSYKIAAGESSVSIPISLNNFPQTVLVFRGLTSVNATAVYNYANSGASNSSARGYAGHSVLHASDRGASASPATSSTGRTALYNFTTSTVFKDATAIYMNHASGFTPSYTDTSDAYGTSGLFFRVQ